MRTAHVEKRPCSTSTHAHAHVHVERGGYVPTADLVAAAEQCAELGERAQGWRRRRVQEFQAIVHNLDALESDLRSFVDIPPTVSAVAGGVNVALLFCMVDALHWPDDELPYRMLTGMPVLGAIEDTGLYRPVTPDCTMAEFRARFETGMATNEAWLDEVSGIVSRRAARATTGYERRTVLHG
eukprot:scaffold141072_cov36-Phaeocystis_antarctica.AAC.1